MSSHIIYIRRKDNTTRLPEEVYAEAKRNIGAFFAGTQIGSGITLAEKKKYLPQILGVTPDTPNFFKQVDNFYNSLTVNVTYGNGTELEIGLDKDGEPINVMDWLKYKFVLAHPKVAPNKEASHSRVFDFYVHDKVKAQKQSHAESLIRRKAMEEYLKLTADPIKVDLVIRALKRNPEKMNKEEKELFIEHESKEDPQAFIEVATNKHLETISFIEQCLSAEPLRPVGNSFFHVDELLGSTLEETINYLEDKKNSKMVAQLKAGLAAFQR